MLQVDNATIRVPFTLISKCRVLSKSLIYFWNGLFIALTRLRLISKIEAEEVLINNYMSETHNFVYTPGLFSFLIVVRGFFQNDQNFSSPILLRDEIKVKAAKKLDALTNSKVRVGMHIRTTDYETWSVLGKQGLVLPSSWYKRAVELINTIIPDASYVIFTDDPFAAKLFFTGAEHLIYSGASDFEDLAAMALCDHLIISPSSYSLAAALASYKPGKIIIAPKYWLGFKSQVWFPADIYSSKLQYLEVNPCEAI